MMSSLIARSTGDSLGGGKAPPSLTTVPRMVVQRKCGCADHENSGGECEDCKKKTLQRSSRSPHASVTEGEHDAPSIVHDVLRSPGQPLDPMVRAFLEPRFGHDFSAVRIHADSRAAESAHAVSADAYTLGHDIVFGAGRFAPGQRDGLSVLAHELAHTIQQRDATPSLAPRSAEVGPADSPLEREADAAAASVLVGGSARVGVGSALTPTLQRQPVHGGEEGINKAARDGVPYEKWSPQVEALYRKVGDPRAAQVASCRTGGREACALLLTLSEVDALYNLASDAKGDESKIRAGLPKAVPALALVGPLPVLAKGALTTGAATGTAAAETGVVAGTAAAEGGAGVAIAGAAVGVTAIVAIVVIAGFQLWKLGQFQAALRAKGFTILEDPLAQAICHSCHGAAPAPTPKKFDFPRLVPGKPGFREFPDFPDFPADLEPRRRLEPVPTPTAPPITADKTPTTEKQPKPTIDVAPDPRPREDDRRRRRCLYPTGLTPADPIPIQWFKIQPLYPSPIIVGGVAYQCDNPTTLPHGEPIGVPRRFWPWIGKIVQLAPEIRHPSVTRDFRDTLTGYGFDWGGRRFLQADHVQDLQWAPLDAESLDQPNNLWPYDGAANASAGPLQNNNQRVSFCETRTGPANVNVPIGSVKRPNGYGRYFIIRSAGVSTLE